MVGGVSRDIGVFYSQPIKKWMVSDIYRNEDSKECEVKNSEIELIRSSK